MSAWWFVGPLAALFSLSACGTQAMVTRPSPPVPTKTVAVLGDSLSVSPGRDASFPAVLQGRLDAEGYGWRVLNFGRNGDTSAQGLARLDEVLAANPDILVLALGANDGLRGVPVATVRTQIDTIVSRATARGIRVLLCGMIAPPIGGWRYTVEFHDIFPALANQYKLPLVPFLLSGVLGNPDFNGNDGVHPNARGAQRIAETIWPYLEPMVRELAGAA